jgi:predicted nucleic acid-binding protein
VVPTATPRVCRDRDDDKFFACAIAGNADYIVSEDDDILAIAEYDGMRTIRARGFIRLLDAAR